MALTQAESYEPFWRQHRDYWRACTPDDVHGLIEDRTFVPPSKAHIKRIQRPRPLVTLAHPTTAPDRSARVLHNQAVAASHVVRAAMRYVAPIVR